MTDQEVEHNLRGRTDINLQTLEDIFKDIDEVDKDVEPTQERNNSIDADEEEGELETSEGPGKGGQRKRSRTGKNVASSSAPPPPAHKYLDGSFLWFNDREEATWFSEKFEHREILVVFRCPGGNQIPM
ncbi:unnamed protein product [Cuscuta campestris]|uniref:Uncharacterized protein n=1 Tax=Cuscuta campestris TaxID=132261 RepID=A0A484MNK6_9ASTE|nr:unnamed protein product [Cuscuta campestris]